MAIVVDDKDWTWVLRERCPECGLEVGVIDPATVAERVRASVPKWREVLARPGVAERRRDDRWSDLEYGCHVRDVYWVCDARLRLMLEEDDPLFPNWDQDATAAEDAYSDQDPSAVADELAATAEAFAARLEQVTGAQWDRPGRRSDGASFTVASFARYVLHDPEHHLWDVGSGGAFRKVRGLRSRGDRPPQRAAGRR